MLNLAGTTLSAVRCHLATSISAWGSNPQLQQLVLKDCKMPQDVSVDVAKSLSACKNLTHLSLSVNTLGDGGHHLAHTITSWGPVTPLQKLYLRDCEMSQDASVDVIKSLSACKHLTDLCLEGNTLGDGGHHLADTITACRADPTLQELWLTDCKMPQDASVDVIKSLSSCKHLTRLDLSGNTLGDGAVIPQDAE